MTISSFESTIAAIATPRGTGGVAIIRLSGPQSWAIVQSLSQSKKKWLPRRVYHDWLVDPSDDKVIDEVILLPFKAPHSYTGEDVVEIHCHGGLYLSRMLLKLCLDSGAEPALAGEFTRRALLNGRMDLTQAESILDLIQAHGEALVKLSAYNMHHRVIGALLEEYLMNISAIQAELSASIDFPDEVEEPDRRLLAERLRHLALNMRERLEINRRNQIIREGIEVAVVGPPNAGKSSLFNALLESERSIVTEVPGTTRDVIREPLSLQGIPLTLIDTAGLRETADQVEMIGVERSWQTIGASQAIIYVMDGTKGLTSSDRDMLERLEAQTGLIVQNKLDRPDFHPAAPENPKGWPVIQTSAKSGAGVSQVLDWLESLSENIPSRSETDYLLSERQLRHLAIVQGEIDEAAEILESPLLPLDLATVALTDGLLELQALLGKDTTEIVLDSVFERFCVGK